MLSKLSYPTTNHHAMGVTDQLRSSLIQRIERADDRMLRVIYSVMDAVAAEYVAAPRMTVAEYEASLKPMTVAELVERAEASNADIAAGRLIDLEDLLVAYS